MKTKKGLAAAASLLPLAIGLATFAGKPPSAPTESEKTKTSICADVGELGECPETGCADPTDDAEHALVNSIKRSLPKGNTPKTLTFADFQRLQNQVAKKFGDESKVSLDESERKQLHALSFKGGQISEGDLVQIAGFLVGKPHANKKESVNCGLTGVANNDFHIPFAADPDDDDVDGIVVEMIPQDRPAEWNLKALGKVENAKMMVLVVGQLFYDNMHGVNTDPDSGGGDPKRFSLFEIHPVTRFLVCMQQNNKCDVKDLSQWKKLEELP